MCYFVAHGHKKASGSLTEKNHCFNMVRVFKLLHHFNCPRKDLQWSGKFLQGDITYFAYFDFYNKFYLGQ